MLHRNDNSILGQWWWSIDRWLVFGVMILTLCGIILMMAATPAIAERLHLPSTYFIQRYIFYLCPVYFLIFGLSFLSITALQRISLCLLSISIVLLWSTLFIGQEIKGARRWISIGGLSLQPSELIKPCFIIAFAWVLAHRQYLSLYWYWGLLLGLYSIIIIPLCLQPDVGMIVVISGVGFLQLFVSGVPLRLLAYMISTGIGGIILAYLYLPHVTSRINRFLDPESGDCYQINQSLNAFIQGGLLGKGPGEGTVKHYLPDAHADFIFAVLGEEFGPLACLMVIGVFVFVVLRGYYLAIRQQNLFVVLTILGILSQFALQALINMGSTLNLIPTKGMTLPFISYGGSASIGMGLGIGVVLALTRKRA